jgi:uncharacterized protein with FMN-binding domain
MRQRAAATIAGLALAGALLINFKSPSEMAAVVVVGDRSSGTSGSTSTGTSTGTSSGSGTSSQAPAGSTTGGSSSGTTGGGTSTASGTFTGPVAANPYGDVQVQVTLANGKITDVQAIALPAGGHSGRISSYVAPILRTQALTAQSAAIDGVSGATYTSQAYAQSLQGALDAAGL